jgi:predicted TPR repeat methyltransferase
MFKHSARLYDRIYDFKDYRAEAEALAELIRRDLRSGGRRLLDVACGTGLHLQLLRAEFEVEGLDLDGDLLEIAHERLPGIPLHQGDMIDFDLGREFDSLESQETVEAELAELKRRVTGQSGDSA